MDRCFGLNRSSSSRIRDAGSPRAGISRSIWTGGDPIFVPKELPRLNGRGTAGCPFVSFENAHVLNQSIHQSKSLLGPDSFRIPNQGFQGP